MTNSDQTQPAIKEHPFERTIGPSPFKFDGFFDLGRVISALSNGNVDAHNNGMRELGSMGLKGGGGTCSHCGMPILNIYIVKNAKGERYGIGSDCIAKLGTGKSIGSKEDLALLRKVREHKTQAANQRADARIKAAFDTLDSSETLKKFFEDQKNKEAWKGSVLDSINWNRSHAGRAGKLRTVRQIEEVILKVGK